MVIKLIIMLKESGALVQDIPTSEKTIDKDVKDMDEVLDDLFEAMKTRDIIRFEDERLKNFIANGEYIAGCQYVIAEDAEMKEVKKK